MPYVTRRTTIEFVAMPHSDLFSLVEQVTDERSFITFLAALAADHEDERAKERISPSSPYGTGANGWENGTIEAFLDSAAAWADASFDSLPLYTKPDNPWRRCAEILHMGKHYE